MGTKESQIARHKAAAELIGKKGKYNSEYKALYDAYFFEEMKKAVGKTKIKEEPKEEEEIQAPPKASEPENPEVATPE